MRFQITLPYTDLEGDINLPNVELGEPVWYGRIVRATADNDERVFVVVWETGNESEDEQMIEQGHEFYYDEEGNN